MDKSSTGEVSLPVLTMLLILSITFESLIPVTLSLSLSRFSDIIYIHIHSFNNEFDFTLRLQLLNSQTCVCFAIVSVCQMLN